MRVTLDEKGLCMLGLRPTAAEPVGAAHVAATSPRRFDRSGVEPAVRREFAALAERASGAVVECAGAAA
ncbi:hypothetical protein ACF061_33775 [Streptomyces sp. NPDC015220]|uniref:hypothetical protein n=1 Tax=Streptomyces sp. NPDC015220 TaxID=3364947 RepID=UPI0036F5EB55